MGIWAGVRNMTLADAVVISSGQMAQLTVKFFTFSLITKRILAHAHDLDGLQSHQVNCTWVMEALGTDDYPEMAIIGEWEHYNIGVTPGCSSDYLKVYDGSTTHARLIGTFCGPIPPLILKSSTKFMTFELVTTELSTGFVFDWVQTLGPAQGCGGIIEHHSGSVSSPNYPHEYISDLFCLWEFLTSKCHFWTFYGVAKPSH